jgi:hypothetical protein
MCYTLDNWTEKGTFVGLITRRTLTIRVTPFPARLSARSFVSLLSRYGMWPPFLRASLSEAMQYPETHSVQTPSHTLPV